MKRLRSLNLLWGILGVLILATLIYPAIASSDEQGSIEAAWQRAREAGSYRFAADVVQTTVPLPTVTNVGRQSKRDALRIEGQTNLPDQTMRLTLWSQGGSVLNAESGVEVRVEGDRAFARQGAEPWQEVNDFTGLFAPEGDFLAYLAAARDAINQGTETRTLPPRVGGDRGGAGEVTFTRYTFEINGPGFAAYLRDQLQQHLTETGELPPGVSLDLPRQYAGMAGEGELWVGEDGLPLRQIIHLQFPPRPDDHQIEADVTVDFSDFGDRVARAQTRSALAVVAGLLTVPPRAPQQATFLAGTLALVVVMATHSRSKKLYVALAVALIASMVCGPFLQQLQAASFGHRQAARVQEQEQRQQESDMARTLRDLQSHPTINPHANPRDFGIRNSEFGINPQSNSPQSDDDGTDADNDGLTDYQEAQLGTNPAYGDSDGDGVSDYSEVVGFDYDGQTWYTDPLEKDTNRDGIGDGQEWNLPGSTQTTWDTDNDGTPDLFDRDNDGDGVPDNLDLSPHQSSATFSGSNPLSLKVDDLEEGKATYVEFQLRPTNPDRLWYAFNVLDWPKDDKRGQVQDADGVTFHDLDPNTSVSPNDNGDMKLVPMLEIRIIGSPTNLPSQDELTRYGISVQDLEADGGDKRHPYEKAAYVPLQLVTDDKGDAHVAFYGKMLYRPSSPLPGGTEGGWGNAQQVRLVWLVHALVDVCEEYDDGICAKYSEKNQLRVVQTYHDDWRLTGLSVREDHGTDVAFIYEDPQVDDDLNDDASLVVLANGLDYTFLSGQDADENGQRDVTVAEIYNRFNRTTNGAYTEEQRWNIPNILHVEIHTYEHLDVARATIPMTDTKAILNDVFTAHWSPSGPITPTLMFAREEHYRVVNLDVQGHGSNVQWSGSQLTVDLPPSGADGVPVQTLAGINWAPYRYRSGAWEACPIDEYWRELARRYPTLNEDEELAAGLLLGIQLYYLVLYNGVNSIVQVGDDVLQSQAAQLEEPEALKTGGKVIEKVIEAVYKLALAGINPRSVESFWRYLGQVSLKAGLARLAYVEWLWRWPSALAEKYDWLKWLGSGWGRGIAVTLTLAAVVALVTMLVSAYFNGVKWVEIGLNILIGGLMTTIKLIGYITAVVEMIRSSAFGFLASMKIYLCASHTWVGATKWGGLIGLIIGAIIVWVTFFVQASDMEAGSIEYNQLLAQSIAATILLIVMFIIALTVIGLIIVAIVSLIDVVLAALGLPTISGWLTEKIASLIYHVEPTIESDATMGELNMSLGNPSRGLRAGNTLALSTNLTTTIVHQDPEGWRVTGWVPVLYTESNLRSTTFNYQLNRSEQDVSASRGEMSSAWQDVEEDHTYSFNTMYRGWVQSGLSVNDVPLQAGVNRTMPVYLNVGYAIPCVECWTTSHGFVCSDQTFDDSLSLHMGQHVVFDVFPATLDEFYALNWGDDFRPQADADGDGLLSFAHHGNDPDDSRWDSDGDGLSDKYELRMRAAGAKNGGADISPLSRDSDNDGLSDGEEVRLGTNPDNRDTDRDGLSDKEELDGWDFEYDAANHLKTHVTSSPFIADEDGDGLSDLAEHTLGTHPKAFTTSGLGIYPESDDEDWIVAPGVTFAYTSTVRNNLSQELYALGGLTVTFPSVLEATDLSTSFDLFQGEAETVSTDVVVDGGAGSQSVDIANEMTSQLHAGSVESTWTWDPRQDSHREAASGKYPWYSAIAPASGWSGDYVVAALEADSTDEDDNEVTGRIVVYQAGDNLDGASLHVDDGDYDKAAHPPAIACANNGRCLVVWAEEHSDDFDIYAAIVGPNLQLVKSSFSIVRSHDHEQEPSVATNGSDFLVGWQRLHDDWEIKTRIVTNDGDVDSHEERLDSRGAQGVREDRYVDLAYVGGNYVAVWENHFSSADFDVWYAYLDGNGHYVSDSCGKIAYTNSMEELPQVAYDPNTDKALVVYRYEGEKIRGHFVQDSSVGSAFTIGTKGSDRELYYPRVAYDPQHKGWLAMWEHGPDWWDSPSSVAYQALAANGSVRASGQSYAVHWSRYSGRGTYETMYPELVPRGMSLACDDHNCAVTTNVAPWWQWGQFRYIFLHRLYLREVLPWLGDISLDEAAPVLIDADWPTSTLTSLSHGQYISATGTLIIGGDAHDPTSSIDRVEVRVDNDPWEAATGHESWAYGWRVDRYADGRHTLHTRAVDVVGHTETPGPGTDVILDSSPPQLDTDIVNFTIVTATLTAQNRWTVSLHGTVSDPMAGSEPGSGVRSVEVLLTDPDPLDAEVISGDGWQEATLDGDTLRQAQGRAWAIDYVLPIFNDDTEAVANPTGDYVFITRATDEVGNRTPEKDYPGILILLDHTAPVAELTYPDPSTTTITQTVTLSGAVMDPTYIAIGLDGLEIAFTPADGLASHAVTEPDWEDTALAQSGKGVTTSSWSHPIPADLDGIYQIDLRGNDVFDNRNDNQSTWNHWRGEIDTLAPRVAITVTLRGAGASAETTYDCWAKDFNLVEDGFECGPCSVQAADRHYFDTDWWRTWTSDATQLYQLTPSCTVPGHPDPPPFPKVTACDIHGRCTTKTAGTLLLALAQQDALLDAAVLTPTHESVLTSTEPVSVTVGAYAVDSLHTITVTVDGAFLDAATWPDGAITDTLWSTTWVPSLTLTDEGPHTLLAVASDWAGRVQADPRPDTVIVDTQPPWVSVEPTVLTTTHRLSLGRVALTGLVTDTGGVERVQVTTSDAWNDASLHDGAWRYTWNLGSEPDGVAYVVTARATDVAGRTAQVTETVTVDLVKPAPVTVTLAYINGLGRRTVLTSGHTIRDVLGPTLILEWTASSSDDLGRYYAGWTESPTPDLAALTTYALATDRHHEQQAGEAQALYAHVVAQDVHGNQRWHTLGPIYADTPTTPDYILPSPRVGGGAGGGGNYHGWMDSGCSQIGVNREVLRNAHTGAALNEVQELYLTWNDEALRLAWGGADWAGDGDIFVYFDTGAPGGATTAFNPYTATMTNPALSSAEVTVIGLPAQNGRQLEADYMLWIEDADAVALMRWDGDEWIEDAPLPPQYYEFDPSTGSGQRTAHLLPHTDVYLPFDLLGITDPAATSLDLVALASEEDGLRLWAAMPDKNPLNSERVIDAPGPVLTTQHFTLTQQYEWASLGAGVCPAEGQFTDADVHVDIVADPPGVELGFLEHDLYSLLTPDQFLDADLDSIVDLVLPVDVDPEPVHDGQVINYTVRYANEGTEVAPDVRVTATARGALHFAGSDTLVLSLGDVSAGITATLGFSGIVESDLDDDSAEVMASVADGTHGTFDWIWVQHDVDSAAPISLTITAPATYIRPYANAVHGIVHDPSGVPIVTLEAQALPGGSPVTIACPDATHEDGQWSCLWDVGAANDGDQFALRAQATDDLGHTSSWTDWLTLIVDTTPPTVTLDADVDAALVDTVLGLGEHLFTGQVHDDRQASGLEVCVSPARRRYPYTIYLPLVLSEAEGLEMKGSNRGRQSTVVATSVAPDEPTCWPVDVRPGTTPTGTWTYAPATVQDADGEYQTIAFYGLDAVGNRSTVPLSRTYQVDTVPPAVAVITHISEILLDAYQPVTDTDKATETAPPPVLVGTVSDGGGVSEVYVRLDTPEGDSFWHVADRGGSTWSYTPRPKTAGLYTLQVEALDRAGNIRSVGPFDLLVIGTR